MIVRIVLWRLDETTPSIDELRGQMGKLEPLQAPSAFLVNEAAERVGALVIADEDEPPPAQLDELAPSSVATRTSTRSSTPRRP